MDRWTVKKAGRPRMGETERREDKQREGKVISLSPFVSALSLLFLLITSHKN